MRQVVEPIAELIVISALILAALAITGYWMHKAWKAFRARRISKDEDSE